MIDGICDGGFRPILLAFTENFATRGEVGAAICVTVGGVVVADLRGGCVTVAGCQAPWGPDTLVNLFSVGKGLIALLAARLAGDGQLDLDLPVVRYWPEFGAAGKESVTVRQLITHRAGLPAIRRRLRPGAMLDWAAMTDALAAEPPWWVPGTAHGYHVNTFGFMVGEVLRRVTGRTVGALLREEVAGPLGADVRIGVPAAGQSRIADFDWPGPPPAEDDLPDLSDDELMVHNAYFNPGGLSGAGVINSAAWREAEVPSANATSPTRWARAGRIRATGR